MNPCGGRSARTPGRDDGVATLSLRERQVGALAESGYSNKLIAYELGLAHSTVRVLIARTALKLGAQTRAELIQKLRAEKPTPASALRPTPGEPSPDGDCA